MPYEPNLYFIYGIDAIMLGSLLLLEYHFYITYKKPKIALIDALMINIVAIPCVHGALINNLIGVELFYTLLAPIITFVASTTAIILEISARKR